MHILRQIGRQRNIHSTGNHSKQFFTPFFFLFLFSFFASLPARSDFFPFRWLFDRPSSSMSSGHPVPSSHVAVTQPFAPPAPFDLPTLFKASWLMRPITSERSKYIPSVPRDAAGWGGVCSSGMLQCGGSGRARSPASKTMRNLSKVEFRAVDGADRGEEM